MGAKRCKITKSGSIKLPIKTKLRRQGIRQVYFRCNLTPILGRNRGRTQQTPKSGISLIGKPQTIITLNQFFKSIHFQKRPKSGGEGKVGVAKVGVGVSQSQNQEFPKFAHPNYQKPQIREIPIFKWFDFQKRKYGTVIGFRRKWNIPAVEVD